MTPVKGSAFIWITFTLERMHRWIDAPEEVEYLKWHHRHIFHFKVSLEIKHDDREVEFQLFKRRLARQAQEAIPDISDLSCEQMGNIIAVIVNEDYPSRNIIVEVSEDGENGTYKEYADNE